MKIVYTVERYVVEHFEVEVDASRQLSRTEIATMADDPHAITVLKIVVKKKAI